MTEPAKQPDWLTRVNGGDREALDDLYERYLPRLIGLARARLNERLQAKIAPDDIVQSVFHSFFQRQEGKLAGKDKFSFENSGDLWGLLAKITTNKCAKHAQRLKTQIDNEQRLPDGSAWQPIGKEPGPAEAAEVAEAMERVLSGLDLLDRQIAVLLFQGSSVAEIATQLNCLERKVYRVRERIKERLERAAGPDQQSDSSENT